MNKWHTHPWRRWVAVCGVALLLIGCSPVATSSPAAPDRDVSIMLEAAPEGKDGDHLIVHLAGADGTPITDATVALEGNMNHAGMVPVLADGVEDAADGEADGVYHVPFVFSMLGDWIITVDVALADGTTVSRDVEMRVAEEGVTGMDGMDHAAAEHDHDADHQDDDFAHATGVHAAAVHVHDAKARPSPVPGGNGAVYFLIHNGTDAEVRLIGAESPAANAVEIHESFEDNGTMRMRQLVDGLTLGPDEAESFAPGGLHVMLIGLTAPLVEGETITLTLHFEGADDLIIEVPVVSMDDLAPAGEMDHNH